jgi:hypothetical protein
MISGATCKSQSKREFRMEIVGYFFGHMPVRESFLARMTPSIRAAIPVDSERRFVADWWAHIASYASGLLGGLICCIAIYLKRMRNRL